MSRELRERLEEIRPTCAHGRKIASLLAEPVTCAGTIKACECCQNPACKPSGHHTPWLCGGCTPAAVHRAGIRGPEEPIYDASALNYEVGYIVGLDPSLHPDVEEMVVIQSADGTVRRIEATPRRNGKAEFYEKCRADLETHMRNQRPLRKFPRFDWPTELEKMVANHFKRITAASDIAHVQILAANPWYLHLLARTPRWKAYADGIRG